MAARKYTITHDERTRAKIRTSQLLNRLNSHVFKGIEVSQTQLKAIEILLRKTLPDLSSVELKGDKDSPLQVMVQKFTGDE
jgi:hypothetical protein